MGDSQLAAFALLCRIVLRADAHREATHSLDGRITSCAGYRLLRKAIALPGDTHRPEGLILSHQRVKNGVPQCPTGGSTRAATERDSRVQQRSVTIKAAAAEGVSNPRPVWLARYFPQAEKVSKCGSVESPAGMARAILVGITARGGRGHPPSRPAALPAGPKDSRTREIHGRASGE